MDEVGRDLWWSSGPISMPRKGHLGQAAQDHTGMASEDLQGGGSLHHLSEPPVPVTCKGQKHFLMVRGSPVAPPQLQQKGINLPQPASSTPNAALETVRLFCCKGTLLAHVQLGTHQDPPVLFCKAAFHLVGPPHVLVPGIKWRTPFLQQDLPRLLREIPSQEQKTLTRLSRGVSAVQNTQVLVAFAMLNCKNRRKTA